MRSASGSATEIGVRPTAPCSSRRASDCAELLLGLRAEALELAQLVLGEHARAGRRSTARRARRAAAARAFGPEPLDAQQRDDAGGCFCAQRLELGDLAGLEQLADLLRGALADAVDLLQLLDRQLPEVGRLRGDRLRRALVGAHAERLRVALVEHGELGELAEHVEDVLLRVGHDGHVVAFAGVSKEEDAEMPRRRAGARCASPTRQALLLAADAKLSKLDLVRYYLAVAAGRARRHPRSAHRAQALRQRRRGRGLLPEARARQAPRLAAHGDAVVSVGAHRRGGGRRRRRGPRLDRQPRLHRAAPAPGARRRSRPPRRAARRSRSRARRRLGRRARASRSR